MVGSPAAALADGDFHAVLAKIPRDWRLKIIPGHGTSGKYLKTRYGLLPLTSHPHLSAEPVGEHGVSQCCVIALRLVELGSGPTCRMYRAGQQ